MVDDWFHFAWLPQFIGDQVLPLLERSRWNHLHRNAGESQSQSKSPSGIQSDAAKFIGTVELFLGLDSLAELNDNYKRTARHRAQSRPHQDMNTSTMLLKIIDLITFFRLRQGRGKPHEL